MGKSSVGWVTMNGIRPVKISKPLLQNPEVSQLM